MYLQTPRTCSVLSEPHDIQRFAGRLRDCCRVERYSSKHNTVLLSSLETYAVTISNCCPSAILANIQTFEASKHSPNHHQLKATTNRFHVSWTVWRLRQVGIKKLGISLTSHENSPHFIFIRILGHVAMGVALTHNLVFTSNSYTKV